jgi:DnaJ-class molecular chaperone
MIGERSAEPSSTSLPPPAMAKRKLYDVLGVPLDASEQQIRKAFRELARKYHPDKNPGDKQAEERFKEINRASEVLLNKQKRELYDEFGEQGLREGFDAAAYREWNNRRAGRSGFGAESGAGFGNLEELFEQMRRGAGPRGGSSSGGFGDMFSGDIFSGGPRARGAKAEPHGATADITIEWMEAVLGTQKELSIYQAGGEADARSLKVRIPAGARDGDQVRLRGQAPDGGDIVMRVHVKPHAVFERTKDDLELTLPVTVGEAFHGAKVSVPTPYGPVTMQVPAGVKGGSRLRLKGKGVRRGESTGDLFVKVQIVLPAAEGAADAVDALEKLYGGSVRAALESLDTETSSSG